MSEIRRSVSSIIQRTSAKVNSDYMKTFYFVQVSSDDLLSHLRRIYLGCGPIHLRSNVINLLIALIYAIVTKDELIVTDSIACCNSD